MTRRKIREEIFRAVFRFDFYPREELEGQIRTFFEDGGEGEIPAGEDRTYAEGKCQGILKNLPEIDQKIDGAAEGWTTKRMAKADLSLLRLAVYEILIEKLPAGVAINEAVELAKKYGTETSGSFINGILGRIARDQAGKA